MTDAELRALCEAALRGPMRVEKAGVWFHVLAPEQTLVDGLGEESEIFCETSTAEDAAFIAAARTEVPRLLDRVALLEGLLGDIVGQDRLQHLACELDNMAGEPAARCDCGLERLLARITAALAAAPPSVEGPAGKEGR